jgi:hypothetical protein
LQCIHFKIASLLFGLLSLCNMSREEKQLLLFVADFALKEAERNAMFVKLVSRWIQSVQDVLQIQAQLAQLPDSDERRDIIDQLADTLGQFDPHADLQRLIDLQARGESLHERIELMLRQLKS